MTRNVGRVIAQLRKRGSKRITQNKLACKVKITQAYLSEIETGKTNVTFPVLMRICRAINITATELFLRVELLDTPLTRIQNGWFEIFCGIIEDVEKSIEGN